MTPLSPRGEAIATVVLGAPLLFPFVVPAVTVGGAAALAGVMVYQAFAHAERPRRTALDWAWALLLFQALIATAISPFPGLSVGRLAAIVLGSVLLRALLLGIRSARDLEFALLVYVLGGAIVGLGGLFGTVWPGFVDLHRKVTVLGPLAFRLPHLIFGLPGAEGGFHPNAIGGATLLFIPLTVMLGVRLFRRESRTDRPVAPRTQLMLLLIALIPLTLVLVLGQSRTAWLALGVVAVGLALWGIRSALLTGVVAALALAAIVASGIVPATLAAMNAAPARGALIPGNTRPQLWARGLHELRKRPLVGIGLDAFRISAREASPPYAGTDSVHVHNVFLQTALDLGIPGLVAFVALLIVPAGMAVHVDARGTPGERLIVMGLLANIAAVTLFGMYDAVVFGTKLSLCIWWNLGLIETLHQRVAAAPTREMNAHV